MPYTRTGIPQRYIPSGEGRVDFYVAIEEKGDLWQQVLKR